VNQRGGGDQRITQSDFPSWRSKTACSKISGQIGNKEELKKNSLNGLFFR
jgi:hypothetical protein